MEKKIAPLVGALAGLAGLSVGAQGANASTAFSAEPMAVTSYSDLLQPIPNARAVLQAHNARMLERAGAMPNGVRLAQWGENDHHHHHHHHHHNQGYYYGSPPPPAWYYAPPPPVYPHHHHHHHHHHDSGLMLFPGFALGFD